MKKSKIIYALWIVIVLVGFCSLYIVMHPSYLQSPDDWTYVSYMRQAWPVPHSWNPARIFQETIGGMIGNISAFFVYPLVGDYIKAFAASYGFVYAITAVFYICFFDKMIKSIFNIGIVERIFLSFCFIFFHFQITKTEMMNNDYLLNPCGITVGMCYFLPFLLCGALVFHIFEKSLDLEFDSAVNLKEKLISIKTGLLLFLLYICVFSNLVESGVLFSAVAACFIVKIWLEKKVQKNKKNKINKSSIWFSGKTDDKFWSKYYSHIIVFVFGLICLLCEAGGGRSGDFQLETAEGINYLMGDMKRNFNGLNIPFVLITSIVIIAALIIAMRKKDDSYASVYLKYISIVGLSLAQSQILCDG